MGKTIPSPIEQEAKEKIALLVFARLIAIYGERFSSRMTTEQSVKAMKREWGNAMEGIHYHRIDRAIERCSDPLGPHKTFPPSLGEFKALCWPSQQELGLPMASDAYRAAMSEKDGVWVGLRHEMIDGELKPAQPKEWSNPVIAQTMNTLGSQFFKEATNEVALKEFTRVYNDKIKEYLSDQIKKHITIDKKLLE